MLGEIVLVLKITIMSNEYICLNKHQGYVFQLSEACH